MSNHVCLADGYRLPSNPTMLRGAPVLVNRSVTHDTRALLRPEAWARQPILRLTAAPAATVPATPPATAAANTPTRAALRPVR